MTIQIFFHNLAITLIIFFAALGLGSIILSVFLRNTRNDELTKLWFSSVIGLGGLSVITLVLGMAGQFNFTIISFLSVGLALLGLFQGYLSIKKILPQLWSRTLLRLPTVILIIFVSSSLIWIFLTHAMMPPYEWDEVAYHLALAKLYVQNGQIYYIPDIVTSNWPLNNTMLYSLALFWKADIAPHFIMFALTLLIVGGLIYFSHKFSVTYVGWIAAALFITIPLTTRLAGTGLIDVGMGVYALAAVVAFEFWFKKRKKGWLVLCGLSCGFIAGSKLTGAAFIIILGIMITVRNLYPKLPQKREFIWEILIFFLAATVVSLPWYIRSVLFTGNPIFPYAYSIFGGLNWDLVGNEYFMDSTLSGFSPNFPRNFPGLIKTFELMLKNPSALGGYQGGLGVILPVGFLISMVSIPWTPRWFLSNAFVCTSFFFAWFMLVSLHLRYLLPIAPLMAWNLAYFIIWLYRHPRLKRIRLLFPLILLVVIWIGWPWADRGERNLFLSRFPYLIGQVQREEWLETNIDVLPVFKYANTYLPKDSLLLLLPYENRGYYLDIPYFWGHPMSQRVIKFETFDNPTRLAETLRKMGITHIIDNPNLIFTNMRYWEHDRQLMIEIEQQCSEEIFSQNNITLFKLQDCSN